MALTKPLLFNIPAFDSSDSQIFTFNSIGGVQITKNRLIIRNNVTLVTVYDQTQTTFKFEHNLPANILVNGAQYNAQIQTFDVQNNSSPLSDPILFWCYTKPEFSFTNIPIGNVIENSSFGFEVTYNQAQGELLNNYIFNLYNVGSLTPLSSSGVMYPTDTNLPSIFSYLFTGFQNESSYSVECIGNTVEGTEINTGRIDFNVIYVVPSVFTLIGLTNNCQEGYVGITSNLALIEGESFPEPPNYIDDKEVDLRNPDWWVKWPTGYRVNNDFSMGIWGRSFNQDSKLFTFSTVAGDTLELYFRYGYVNDDDSTPLMCYIDLYSKNISFDIRYYVFSNYIPIPTEEEQIFIYLRRVRDLFDIAIANRGVII